MTSEDRCPSRVAYSIDLYAINLNEKGVPESHARMSCIKRNIRLSTPMKVALNNYGCCPRAGPMEKIIVSDHLSGVISPRATYPYLKGGSVLG